MAMQRARSCSDLAEGWNRELDDYGQPYYIEKSTGRIQKEKPKGPTVTITKKGETQAASMGAFIDPDQWDIVIDTMAASIHPSEQLRVFIKLRKIAEKMLEKDDPKYRSLYLNNPQLQKSLLVFDGGLEFLYNLGYIPSHEDRQKLVCHRPDSRVINACLICLGDKINSLRNEANPNQAVSDTTKNDDENERRQPTRSHTDTFEYPTDMSRARSTPMNSSNNNERITQAKTTIGFSKNSGMAHSRSKSPPKTKPPAPNRVPTDKTLIGKSESSSSILPKHDDTKKEVLWKVIILIRHGNSYWNSQKNDGSSIKKWTAVGRGLIEMMGGTKNHNDSVVVDAPLSKNGIDEAFGLSKFLSRHVYTRRFHHNQTLIELQKVSSPIKDAVRVLQTQLFDDVKYQKNQNLCQKLNDLQECVKNAQQTLEKWMLEVQSGKRLHDHDAYGCGDADLVRNNHDKEHSGDGHSSSTHSHKEDTEGDSTSPRHFRQRYSVYDIKKHQDLMAIISAEANGDFEINEEEFKNENKEEPNKIPIKHVVLNDATFGVIEDQPDLPLEMEWILDEMLDYKTSIVTCSNLRRAISTAIIGLWDRFGIEENQELVHILPCLQELGMHVDTHTPVVDDLPQVSEHEKKTQKLDISLLSEFYSKRLCMTDTTKKSSRFESVEDTKDRMRSFLDWVFNQRDKRTVIAVGHSHWFQHFFATFLPPGSTHMSGKRKLNNCGVVAFRMCCEVYANSERRYIIKEGSITQVYGTFG